LRRARGRAAATGHRNTGSVVGQEIEILDRHLADGFGHRLRVAGPLARLEAAQGLTHVLLTLSADARHLLAAAQVVAVAEHTLVLAREVARLVHPRRIGWCRRRCRGHRGQRVDDRGEAAHVVVLHRLGDRGHRFIAAPPFAEQEELGDRIEAMLAGQRRRAGHVAATVRAVARGAERCEAWAVRSRAGVGRRCRRACRARLSGARHAGLGNPRRRGACLRLGAAREQRRDKDSGGSA